MGKDRTAKIASGALVAALYVVLNYFLSSISFGAIQFRAAEMLCQLAPYSTSYYIGIIIGCFIANLSSPLGWYDLVFGVASTILGIGIPLFITGKSANANLKHFSVGLGMTLSMVLIAWELNLAFDLPFLLTWLTVSIGEAATQIVGAPIIIAISKRVKL
jgi:uncharacterized membrane protein